MSLPVTNCKIFFEIIAVTLGNSNCENQYNFVFSSDELACHLALNGSRIREMEIEQKDDGELLDVKNFSSARDRDAHKDFLSATAGGTAVK